MKGEPTSWRELVERNDPAHFARALDERPRATWLIAAPHGGKIEPGTTQIAREIAGQSYSFYTVEGLKHRGNRLAFHITSHLFDEPEFLNAAPKHDRVLGIHGCGDDRKEGIDVWVGGGDDELARTTIERLQAAGYGSAIDETTRGREKTNVCNRGQRRGIQFELPKAFRSRFFASLDQAGLQQPTTALGHFSDVVREMLTGVGAVSASPMSPRSRTIQGNSRGEQEK